MSTPGTTHTGDTGDTAAPTSPPHPRARLVLTAVWLLATVLAATIAWWAVTAVGGERAGDGAGLVSQAELEHRLAEQAAGTGGDGSGDGAGGGAGTPTDDPAATPGPTASRSPTTDPGTDPGVQPGTPPATDPTASPTVDPAPAPPAPADVARTWDVTGGAVAAVCTGASIGLLYATPADGWSVAVEHAGPEEVEVHFARGGEDAEIRAECVAGTPQITRQRGSGSGSGGGDNGGGGGDD